MGRRPPWLLSSMGWFLGGSLIALLPIKEVIERFYLGFENAQSNPFIHAIHPFCSLYATNHSLPSIYSSPCASMASLGFVPCKLMTYAAKE